MCTDRARSLSRAAVREAASACTVARIAAVSSTRWICSSRSLAYSLAAASCAGVSSVRRGAGVFSCRPQPHASVATTRNTAQRPRDGRPVLRRLFAILFLFALLFFQHFQFRQGLVATGDAADADGLGAQLLDGGLHLRRVFLGQSVLLFLARLVHVVGLLAQLHHLGGGLLELWLGGLGAVRVADGGQDLGD